MNQDQSLKLYVVLSRTYHAIVEAEKKEIKKYGISPTEFAVLELLLHKGARPIQYIASKVLLKSGSMTYVITQLEKKGFVKRVVSQEDRRIYYAELTNKGKRLIEKIFPLHASFLHKTMSVLNEQEGQNVIEQLKVLGKNTSNEMEELQ